ncbi:sugar O-acyltransferase, sialic acid O-acetyltransferase NeuD family [Pseudooceanicola antarcticus]|uniref:Sugar O-acyltransferase, sialic acid O-acetyltransferase NeuD family n=1 Tax=Pseudooceanicola antarcticus TaxID=1247613 RepID=A0A285J0J3_9RHOB|nr:acetyltransferase [Pseudooceanicola antarcticus]PJE25830.1 hypothetical protein CVM39_19195 [Pseudooceanicola antarcticus]SNY52681.1 sugar O-acyltransferase, sialic acid O-acetyltransferase NeuD family [Pseudooceanicola antarcticus]
MPRTVLIMGTTAYTEVFIDMFEAIADVEFVGCIENLDRAKCAGNVAGLPVHWHEDVHAVAGNARLICSLATPQRRDWIVEMSEAGFEFETLIHPSATVSKRTEIGAGSSIDAGCVVAGYSRISGHVRMGRRVSFGHHTEVGAYTTLHPGCIVSGNCKIGSQVVLGTGSVILDGRTIGDGAVVAAGAIVTKDVPPYTMVAGNPAVFKRRTDQT